MNRRSCANRMKISVPRLSLWDIPPPTSVPTVPASGATCGAPSREAAPTVFYKLSGQILTLCEADGTVASNAVRRTLHKGETPDAVVLELVPGGSARD
jgi:hypothetical protein